MLEFHKEVFSYVIRGSEPACASRFPEEVGPQVMGHFMYSSQPLKSLSIIPSFDDCLRSKPPVPFCYLNKSASCGGLFFQRLVSNCKCSIRARTSSLHQRFLAYICVCIDICCYKAVIFLVYLVTGKVFQASFAYFCVIFGIKYVMRNRAPFDLTLPLNIWNALLAIFSIIGTIMLFPEFAGTIRNNGFQGLSLISKMFNVSLDNRVWNGFRFSRTCGYYLLVAELKLMEIVRFVLHCLK